MDGLDYSPTQHSSGKNAENCKDIHLDNNNNGLLDEPAFEAYVMMARTVRECMSAQYHLATDILS